MEGIDDLLIVTLDVENGERGIRSIALLKGFSKKVGCRKDVTNLPSHASLYAEQSLDVLLLTHTIHGAVGRKDRHMLGLHWPELLIIVSLGVLLFGSKKLPDLSRSIGKGIVEFKKGISGASSDEKLPPPKE